MEVCACVPIYTIYKSPDLRVTTSNDHEEQPGQNGDLSSLVYVTVGCV